MFKNAIPALITPFKDSQIDENAYRDLIERQIQAGASALVPVGTTGESATLSHDEHRRAVHICIEAAAGRIPVIAGCGSNSTQEAMELVTYAKWAGADAALVVCPYYNRPCQNGLYAHFKTINNAVALPLFLYNVPSRTASDILPETVGKLAKLPNIIGIKDATSDLKRVTEHRLYAGEDFIQLSGDDPSALGHRAMGGVGCISVTANVAPEHLVAMHEAASKGDYERARSIELNLIELHKALFISPSPGPTKYALSKLGLCHPDVRLPVMPPNAQECAIIDKVVQAALFNQRAQ